MDSTTLVGLLLAVVSLRRLMASLKDGSRKGMVEWTFVVAFALYLIVSSLW